MEPGEEAETFRTGLAGQLIFSMAEAADGKRLAAVQMVLSAEFHGQNHLAFAGENGMHKVRLNLTFDKSSRRLPSGLGDEIWKMASRESSVILSPIS